MTSAQLKEQREQKLEALNAIITKAESENDRAFTADEKTKYDALMREVETTDTQIDEAVEREAIKMRVAEMKQPKIDKRGGKDNLSPEGKAASRFSFLRAIRSQIPSLNMPLDGIELEMHQEALREAKETGIQITGYGVPSMLMQKRDGLLVGTTTAGGHTVETELMGLIPFLNPEPVIQKLGATFLTGLRGNVDFPRVNAQGSGAWETEISAANEVIPTFDKISLTPKRWSGYIPYSKQLLLQSSTGIENFVRQDFAQLIAQELDKVAFNGGGSNEPTGIIATSGTGSVAGGTAITFAKLVELITDVMGANALKGNLAYVTTPQVYGQAIQTPKETGQAIYLWNDGSTPGEGTMLGYRALTSSLVPTNLGVGTNEHAIIFGNWADLLIGQWGGIDLVVDPYSLVRTAQIQIVVNIFVDVALRHPESFSTMEGVDVS